MRGLNFMIKSINSIMTWLITIFVIVITIIISSINIYTIMDSNDKSLDIYRKEVYDNNKDMITYETQIATNIVHQFYEKELSGEYTREEAMYKAANTIRNLKYGDGGYFFIYDIEGNTVVLFGSELERSNRINATSSDGNQFVKQLIESARNNPSGEFNTIKINKPHEDREQDKIVYSKLFLPYNWVIGTGVYTNDIEEDILYMYKENDLYLNKVILTLILLSISLWVLTFFIASKASNILSKPLLHITDRMNRISTGDLDKNQDDVFTDEIFSNSLNEFAKLNKASNILTRNLNSIIGFMTQSIDKITGISNNLNTISTTSSKYIESINKTINQSYMKYENEIDSIAVLHAMIQKDKAALSNLNNDLTNIHTSIRKYTDSINNMKETINAIILAINNNKDRNMNSIFLIKEITSDYDRINSTIGLVSNILFQKNIYISKIMESIDDENYDVTKDINNIKDLNYRAQENMNSLHSILIGTMHAFRSVNDSVNAEMDALSNSNQLLDNSNIMLDAGLERINESCKEIYDVISEMNHVVYDLDIQYVALEELNTKFKDINKEIQLVVSYSNDVNDNMDKISVFISQLGVITNKINQRLIKKIKR